ncbi:ABC transporter permease [Rhizobium sp. ACO-34A]|nr:ABC transporter permease subunit [Rhizobium sp. ACO-34A]ATN35997.1 ABC transporter permease [Rhizobium sp. ACO-34A]
MRSSVFPSLGPNRIWLFAALPAVIFLLVFLVYPLLQVLVLGIQDKNGDFTLTQFARLFESSIYVRVLLNSVKIAALTSVFCILAGYPVAYLLSIVRPGTRAALLIWVLLPLWTSFLVRAVAWILMLSNQGVLNSLLLSMGLIDSPLRLINTFAGVLIGTVHAMVPIAIMMMLPVMSSIDGNLSRAAATLGARGAQVFWRIYLPLSLPGIVAAGLIVFVNSLGFFVASQLLGGVRDVMISQLIIQQIEEVFDLNFAGALSVVLLVATLVVITVFNRVLGLSTLTGDHSQASGGMGGGNSRVVRKVGMRMAETAGDIFGAIGDAFDRIRGPRMRSSDERSRPVLWTVCATVFAFIAAPAFILLPVSFTASTFLSWPPKGFSLQWYEVFFTTPAWSAALLRSVAVGLLTATLAMTLGIPAAYALAKQRIPGKSVLLMLVLIPVVLPSIIIGVGLFYLYSRIGLLQTSAGLVLGHTIFALPYVVITTMAALRTYDERLDQAAWTLGATRFATFRLISLPLMKAGMAAAFLFAFVQSFDELSVSLFVASPAMPTLPRQLWAEALYRLSPTLAAASSIMICIVAVPIVCSQIWVGLGRRRK